MTKLNKLTLFLLVVGISLVVSVYSAEAKKEVVEKDISPLGGEHEKELVKRAADEDADEKPKPKKKGKKNKTTTTTSSPSSTGSPSSTTKKPADGSTTTGKPSTTTGKPADKSTTAKPSDASTTTTGKPKDDQDTEDMMKAIKNQGEEKILLDKLLSDLNVWEAWIDSKQKCYNPRRWGRIYDKVSQLSSKVDNFRTKEESKRTTLKPLPLKSFTNRPLHKYNRPGFATREWFSSGD